MPLYCEEGLERPASLLLLLPADFATAVIFGIARIASWKSLQNAFLPRPCSRRM